MNRGTGQASSRVAAGEKAGHRRRFQVQPRCIGCAFCAECAPAHFRMHEEEQRSRLFRQPETREEVRLCTKISRMCPADAIGR